MDYRGRQRPGRQRGLRHGVDLRAVESRSENGELIGADIEAVGVRADQRLIAGQPA